MSHNLLCRTMTLRSFAFRVGRLVLLVISLAIGLGAASPSVQAMNIAPTDTLQAASLAPAALDTPADMRCRHYNGLTDQVLLQWDQTADAAANYDLYRENVSAPGWSLLTTVAAGTCEDGTCQFIDTAASNSVVYRYSVQANDGNETSSFSQICREPLVQEDPANQFRVFYRLELTECPTVDGKQTCTENINNGTGQNIHVMQMIATHEAFRQTYVDIGFKDYAMYKGAKPFPIDLYPCNNGCKSSQGIQIPPANLEGTDDYIPATGAGNDYEVFVVGHEAFHALQGLYGDVDDPDYKWLIEGQARSTEDRSCIFNSVADCTLWDNQIDKYYAGAAASYLGFPEQALLESSYIAALFWTYFVEQFGTTTSEPDRGMDALVNYWEQNEINATLGVTKDGMGTLNDLMATLGSPRRFEDIFQDFAVANYLKDYLTHPAPAGFEPYNYVDEEAYALNGNTYGSVKLTVDSPLALDQTILGISSVQAWGARYYQIKPDAAVPSVNIEIEPLAATPYDLYYHVVMIDNGNIVDQYSEVGDSFAYSVNNAADYDQIALIVASMEHAVNFNYGFNLSDGVFILAPTTAVPALVGELTSPEKFIMQVQVLDAAGDPVSGIDPSEFAITVGSTVVSPTGIIASSYLAGQYWFTVRAPSNPGCTDFCDLSVAYAAYSDLKEDAIFYGPKPDTDNMIIIDRSGSMVGEKFTAAQDAAKLYADSYSEGDRIGIISFAATPTEEYPITDWTEPNRPAVETAIDTIDAPSGNTANGAALREGNAKLVAQASPNPVWSIVLLSDGADTVADTDDHIPAYVSEWAAAEKAGDQVPVVHVVAVGDDADGVELSKLTNKTGGNFQFLPVPSEMAAAAGGEAVDATNLAEALSEIYRVFAEEVLDEQQAYLHHFPLQQQPVVNTIQVDKSASQAIFVLKYSPPDALPPTIFLNDPNGGGTVAAIPPTLTGEGHRLWRIPSPLQGDWTLGLRFGCGPDCPEHYMVEAALVSDLILKAFLGLPVEERIVGKPMPIIAFLSDVAPLTGATVKATSETTGEVVTLFDDGLHGDGAANDGTYGGTLISTNLAGGYSVIVDAEGTSPFAGDYTRRVRLGFYLPDGPDSDQDRLPDWWEDEYPCMDPKINDASLDPDGDGLPNAQEYFRKTNPCKPDTDEGGENDGSEVKRGSNPLFPPDDGIRPPTFKPWPAPQRAILRLVLPAVLDNYVIERAPMLTPAVPGPFTAVFSGTTSPIDEWVDPSLSNDQGYCYRVVVQVGGMSATSVVKCTIPKSDPHPPHGVVTAKGLLLPAVIPSQIVPSQSGPGAVPRTLILALDGEDDPTTEEHPAFDGALLFPDAVISGVKEMMISNRADFAGAQWEPYATTKLWTLEVNAANQATVFVLFKDGAGNVSDVVHETFTVDPSLPAETEEPQEPEQQLEMFMPSISRP